MTNKIAGAEEVLAYLTARMRGDTNDSGQIKAAELLAKHYGLLTERADAMGEVPYIIDDIAPADGQAETENETEDEAGGAPDG